MPQPAPRVTPPRGAGVSHRTGDSAGRQVRAVARYVLAGGSVLGGLLIFGPLLVDAITRAGLPPIVLAVLVGGALGLGDVAGLLLLLVGGVRLYHCRSSVASVTAASVPRIEDAPVAAPQSDPARDDILHGVSDAPTTGPCGCAQTDLRRLLQEIVGGFAPALPGRAVDLTLVMESGVPRVAVGPAHLRRVVSQVLIRMATGIDHGTIALIVSTTADGAVQLVVRASALGARPAEPLATVADQLTDSQRCLAQSGARMAWAGTTVTITLPVRDAGVPG